MDNYQLDYSDVEDIFKDKLKIDNKVKTITSVFRNERYFSKINPKPYFQRNYVWDDEKATYFIESILLGTEIPPLVFFETKKDNEVIDGRQRFETIDRFLKDKLTLKEKGLHSLTFLKGKKYSQLESDYRNTFLDTRIRILQFKVVNEPRLSDAKEDKIKKEIFRRYNSGITPLQKYDIERAIFIDEPLTILLKEELKSNSDLYSFLCHTMLPRSKKKANQRDKINILLSEIRELITLPSIPIYTYAVSSKVDLIRKTYFNKFESSNYEVELEKFLNTVSHLKLFNKELIERHDNIANNKLFFETLFWAISIINDNGINLYVEDISKIVDLFESKNTKYLEKTIKSITPDIESLFEQTGSHYYSAILNRYIYVSNIFSDYYSFDFEKYIKSRSVDQTDVSHEETYSRNRINKPLPESLSIEDIMMDIEKFRFIIRPNYQRSEVKILSKSSYLMESVLLGISIPPLFIYKRKDNVKEVVDGQQRLLTLLGFLGKEYIDENNQKQYSEKNRFKLSELKILKELKGKNIDTLGEFFIDKILDFQMDIIEIDGVQNPEFSPIDLFLRLNTKPYPIKENTFEMWNAYLDKKIILKVKDIADKYENKIFRAKDVRMKLEELITSLAYIDYKTRHGSDYNNLLCIYVKNSRLCSRLMSKKQMTKQLYDISINAPEDFILSLKNIEEFVKKTQLLIDYDSSNLKIMFNHLKKGTSYKTDQNFYFLWIMLNQISYDDLLEKKEIIFEKIKTNYKKSQNINILNKDLVTCYDEFFKM